MPKPLGPLLVLQDLTVHYGDDIHDTPVVAIDRLELTIEPGEVLGVLGESGCGKSSLALAILGLLPPDGRVAAGSVKLHGRELVGLPEAELRRVRGARIGLVFQEPSLALHPLRRVGAQVVEVLRAHRAWSRRRCREQARHLLAEDGFDTGDQIDRAYPHQLSGGQRQRIVIAQALACRPELLIADEPTVSLDSVTEKQVLDLLRRLRDERGMAVLHISHDPLVLAEVADRLLVMYAGRWVEEGPCRSVLADPRHPYTRGLLAALPPGEPCADHRELPILPGPAFQGFTAGPGCRFAPRCSRRSAVCTTRDPHPDDATEKHRVWCFGMTVVGLYIC